MGYSDIHGIPWKEHFFSPVYFSEFFRNRILMATLLPRPRVNLRTLHFAISFATYCSKLCRKHVGYVVTILCDRKTLVSSLKHFKHSFNRKSLHNNLTINIFFSNIYMIKNIPDSLRKTLTSLNMCLKKIEFLNDSRMKFCLLNLFLDLGTRKMISHSYVVELWTYQLIISGVGQKYIYMFN